MKAKYVLMLVNLLLLISLISAHTGNDDVDHCSGFCSMMSGVYGIGFQIFAWVTVILIIIVLVLIMVLLIKKINRNEKR